MIVALVDGTRTPATPGRTGTCPVCGHPVTAKCGHIVRWHWAHAARADCDPWAEPDHAWHLAWQTRVPIERREVVVGAHRADIVAADGTVVELQHSYLAPDQIAEREEFYDQMVWLFDATRPVDEERLFIRTRPGKPYVTFRWKHPRKSIAMCTKPTLLDLGSGRLLRLRRMYPEAPCGGWGHLVSAAAFTAWLNTTPAQAAS